MTLADLTRIETSSAAELFGTDPDKAFKKLSLLCHPDRHPPERRERAEKAMQRLSELRESLKIKPELARVGKWVVSQPLAAGGISDLYQVDGAAVLRIARLATDNDLLAIEARHLKLLRKESTSYQGYFPEVLETFEASGRRANVTVVAEGCFSLAYIVGQFGGKLDFRHVVWMMNRILSALGYAHSKGIIHGAVLPNHLLYRPADHGLVLVDWACSVGFPDDNAYIPIISKAWKTFYPAEVYKKGCFCSTDLYMAAKCMIYAAGGQSAVPRRFQAFFEHLTAGSPASRPHDAWAIQDRWKALAREEYGEPKFLELAIPVS